MELNAVTIDNKLAIKVLNRYAIGYQQVTVMKSITYQYISYIDRVLSIMIKTLS